MADLARFEESPHFSDVEKLVLRLSVAMNRAPSDVPETLFAELRTHFDEAQLVELAAEIAWENFRSRFNRVFDVQSVGYSDGAACALPERPY